LPNLPIEHLYEPTTQQFSRAVTDSREEETLVIIQPDQRVYPKRKGKKTTEADYKYGLPQAFEDEPDPAAYFFICCGIDAKSFYKKLEGGPYQQLDLTKESYDLKELAPDSDIPNLEQAATDYRLYPTGFLNYLVSYPNIQSDTVTYWAEQFIQALAAGPRQVAQIPASELRQYCLDHLSIRVETENDQEVYRTSILFKNMTAALGLGKKNLVPYKSSPWGAHQELAVYIGPFLELASTRYRSNPKLPVMAFARWVAAASRETGYNNGLSFYTTAKGIRYSQFRPSSQAKEAWAILLTQLQNPVQLIKEP
jgi:hypothetical protein